MAQTKDQKADDVVKCILCYRDFPRAARETYTPLKYFDDAVICNECMAAQQSDGT